MVDSSLQLEDIQMRESGRRNVVYGGFCDCLSKCVRRGKLNICESPSIHPLQFSHKVHVVLCYVELVM